MNTVIKTSAGATSDPGIITPANEQDQHNLVRLLAQEQAAKNGGLSLPFPYFSLGTRVIEEGVKNFRNVREEWDKRPAFGYVAEQALEKIAGEERQDIEIDLHNLCMSPSGLLSLFDDPSRRWNLNRSSIHGLITGLRLNGGLQYLLDVCPPDLRAANCNYWFIAGDSKKYILRQRNCQNPDQQGELEAFAVVSPRYTACDANVLAQVAHELVPPSAKGELLYDGERFRLAASWVSDIQPEHCCAGEIFRAWMFLTCRDDAMGGIHVEMGVERNLCLNLIRLGKARSIIRLRHQGDANELREEVREAIARQSDHVKLFCEGWTRSRQESLQEQISQAGKFGSEALFRGLVEQDLVRVAGCKPEELTARLVRAYQHEPGNTIADVVNAVTRAAHENTWASPWATAELEEQAGDLLYQKVYVFQNAVDTGVETLSA